MKRAAATGAAPRAEGTCPNPGVCAASDTPWAEAVTSRTGAGAVGPAVGGSKQPRPRKRKFKEALIRDHKSQIGQQDVAPCSKGLR